MIRSSLIIVLLLLIPVAPLMADGKPVLEPEEGQSVVFLGSTLIERAQQYGFWESMLTSELSDRQVIFRNLGWSGDTAFAESRGIFDPPSKGYERMLERIKKINPRYVIVSYGGNESFEGTEGVAKFLNQMEVLLRDLKQDQTEVILITPIRFEKAPSPLPDPGEANKNREIYVNGLKKFGEVHELPVIDLFTTLITDDESVPASPKTYNGIHLTPEGYYLASRILRKQLFPESNQPELSLDSTGKVLEQSGINISEFKNENDQISFQVERKTLPLLNARNQLDKETLVRFSVKGLKPGTYTLKIDGETVLQAESKEFESGELIQSKADLKRAIELNEAILKKNELYFHSWRPQNITYLFGFRKHEQGQNAKEVDEMMTLVKKEEEKISSLRNNRSSTWTLTRN